MQQQDFDAMIEANTEFTRMRKDMGSVKQDISKLTAATNDISSKLSGIDDIKRMLGGHSTLSPPSQPASSDADNSRNSRRRINGSGGSSDGSSRVSLDGRHGPGGTETPEEGAASHE